MDVYNNLASSRLSFKAESINIRINISILMSSASEQPCLLLFCVNMHYLIRAYLLLFIICWVYLAFICNALCCMSGFKLISSHAIY